MRYIDADALIKKIYPMGIGDGMYVINAKAVKFAIDNTPTADVVPKSEWNRIYTEIEGLKSSTLPRLRLDLQMANTKVAEADMAKAETTREIFEEIERTLDNYYCSSLLVGEIYPTSYYDAGLEDAIAELKKKRTEEKK